MSDRRASSTELADGRGTPWRPVARVATGGSAVVYRAERDGRSAALKIARTDEPWVAEEARLLRSLGRRWGPRLLDAGRTSDGRAYVATAWVDGQDAAAARQASGPEHLATLAALVAHGVGRGLEELHELGVRHGDVKLLNVVVGSNAPRVDRAEERAATLIDLGLAADTAAPSEARGGTPRYLAPELRERGPATPAADLFALGVVLAEILVPAIAAATDPHDRLPEAFGQGEVGTWIEALVARSPGGRPSARWVADRAASLLGLATDPEEIVLRRQARIRRSYLALRSGPLREVGQGIGAPARTWLEEVVAEDPRAAAAAPLDALALSRWVVGLVGPAAASWPAPPCDEATLAARMLERARFEAPEGWSKDDLWTDAASRDRSIALPALGPERWIYLTRALCGSRPSARDLAAAEDDLARGRAPGALAVELARALLFQGELGRAHAAIARARAGPRGDLLAAEILRRRGQPSSASEKAKRLVGGDDAGVSDQARAVLARIAWDAGDTAGATEALGDARGREAAEVRALVAYAQGETERGLGVLEAAKLEPGEPMGIARLEAARGMLEHARGDAVASHAAFAAAVEIATQNGAVVEEATYLTGLAAAATDAGAVERALASATRAALLWERLGRPALAARAHLCRAAAYALVGASHEADLAATEARAAAAASNDRRAAAFARWAMAETRPPGDARARTEVLAAAAELAGGAADDEVRAAARLLIWADGEGVDLQAMDAAAARAAPATRWEWWGARAAATAPEPRVLAAIVLHMTEPAPLASRGPALAAGVKLAGELGDGDAARRLESARRAAAEVLRANTPAPLGASLAAVPWARTAEVVGGPAPALHAAQVEQLETIVRALGTRDRLRPLLEQVLDTLVLWTGVERGLLLLPAVDGRLVPRAARNLARRDLRGEQLALSTGIAKRAMAERQTICATDAYAQIGDLHASVHALRLRSVLAVPLLARGDVLGVVYLDDRERRGAFGPSELAWVRVVASQAATAIADARDQVLLRRAVRRADRARARLEAELGLRSAELQAVRGVLSRTETRFSYDEIAGRSEPVRAMLRLVDRVTASHVPVLLVGESGTGKELVARAIHANGPRAKESFVSENCASVPETLLESTLFGHVRGAFTGASSTRAGLFAVADGGTLFLDEIGEMPLSMQAKLLRVLQDGEVRPVGGERAHKVDVRIMAATHRDLAAMVQAGTFREDLFYRLDVVTIRVPPLRERTADIPLLVARFLEKHGAGKAFKVTRAAMDRLSAYPWPGNVRQLENEVRRAMVLANDERIDVPDLSEEVARGGRAAVREAGLGLKARVDALETQLVRDALAQTKGNQTRAAELLGISRFGLQKMIRRLGV